MAGPAVHPMAGKAERDNTLRTDGTAVYGWPCREGGLHFQGVRWGHRLGPLSLRLEELQLSAGTQDACDLRVLDKITCTVGVSVDRSLAEIRVRELPAAAV